MISSRSIHNNLAQVGTLSRLPFPRGPCSIYRGTELDEIAASRYLRSTTCVLDSWRPELVTSAYELPNTVLLLRRGLAQGSWSYQTSCPGPEAKLASLPKVPSTASRSRLSKHRPHEYWRDKVVPIASLVCAWSLGAWAPRRSRGVLASIASSHRLSPWHRSRDPGCALKSCIALVHAPPKMDLSSAVTR